MFDIVQKSWNSSLKVTELWEISLKGTELWEITLEFCVQYIGQRKIRTRTSIPFIHPSHTFIPSIHTSHSKNTDLYSLCRFSPSRPYETTTNKKIIYPVLAWGKCTWEWLKIFHFAFYVLLFTFFCLLLFFFAFCVSLFAFCFFC